MRFNKYHFGDMKIGDSFVVSKEDYFRVANAAKKYGRQHDMKFKIRTVDGETRLWRVE